MRNVNLEASQQFFPRLNDEKNVVQQFVKDKFWLYDSYLKNVKKLEDPVKENPYRDGPCVKGLLGNKRLYKESNLL